MFGFLGNIGTWELTIILLVAVVVVGPSKLPEVVRSVAKVMRDLQQVTSGVRKDFEDAINLDITPKSEPKAPAIGPAIAVTPAEPQETITQEIVDPEETISPENSKKYSYPLPPLDQEEGGI